MRHNLQTQIINKRLFTSIKLAMTRTKHLKYFEKMSLILMIFNKMKYYDEKYILSSDTVRLKY